MYDNILLPIDTRVAGDGYLDHALGLARRFDSTLHILHVVDFGDDPDELPAAERSTFRDSLETVGREAIDRVEEQASSVGIDTVETLRTGPVHRAVVTYADEHDIDGIVMGTHARGGSTDRRLGSTTERVVLSASTPVISVPRIGEGDATDGGADYEVIVIATDGSDASERAADRGISLASSYDADVGLLYVIDSETYDLADAPRSIIGLLKEGGRGAIESLAQRTDGPTRTEVRRGVPEEEILAFADATDADLVVLGVSGRGGAGDRYLGSTTARVLRRGTRPILTVR